MARKAQSRHPRETRLHTVVSAREPRQFATRATSRGRQYRVNMAASKRVVPCASSNARVSADEHRTQNGLPRFAIRLKAAAMCRCRRASQGSSKTPRKDSGAEIWFTRWRALPSERPGRVAGTTVPCRQPLTITEATKGQQKSRQDLFCSVSACRYGAISASRGRFNNLRVVVTMCKRRLTGVRERSASYDLT